MSHVDDRVLDHEIDGIQEYDNPMPAWWLGIFYVTIGFMFVHYGWLWLSGWDQETQYDAEVVSAMETYGDTSPGAQPVAVAAATAADIEAGKAIFTQRCVACHGADAKGGIGPDLTDAVWIHGGSLESITKTVRDGVLEKGMLAWGPMIGDEAVGQVSVYVHTLGGGQ